MLEVLPFVEDPDLSGSAAPALPQLLPPCLNDDLNYLIDVDKKKLSTNTSTMTSTGRISTQFDFYFKTLF